MPIPKPDRPHLHSPFALLPKTLSSVGLQPAPCTPRICDTSPPGHPRSFPSACARVRPLHAAAEVIGLHHRPSGALLYFGADGNAVQTTLDATDQS